MRPYWRSLRDEVRLGTRFGDESHVRMTKCGGSDFKVGNWLNAQPRENFTRNWIRRVPRGRQSALVEKWFEVTRVRQNPTLSSVYSNALLKRAMRSQLAP
jgi:hypothetical protein